MKFGYQFSNLLGSVYAKGNLLFMPDGNTVISSVGNKISLFDLKNNKSETLPVECHCNVTCIALAPSGHIILAVDEEGNAHLISLISRTLLHKLRINKHVNDVKFSPDKRYVALTKDSSVFLYQAPGSQKKEFNPFVMARVFKGAFDDTVCLDWTSDSRVLAVGSKDKITRIYAVDKFENLWVYSLGGHSDSIVGCFFEKDSLDLYTLSKNGQLCVWHCSLELKDLVPLKPKEEPKSEDVEDKGDFEQEGDEQEAEVVTATTESENDNSKIHYKRFARHYVSDLARQSGPVTLTAAAFHRDTHILVSGFSNGAFFLHEMPDYNLIHSLSLGEHSISTISFNATGDWIALGCQAAGQLVVWEWQSESYIMKQQGHFHNMNVLAYSPDSQYIATGGDDCKVKLWNTDSGFCFVTFTEHQAAVTGIVFSNNGKFLVSSSLDGTVRAFDLLRYRNFRTFASPRPTQFSCIALDGSSEIVCAGSQDVFEIFAWSVKNGRLLEVLSGHEGPISSLSFSSRNSMLASSSWDKTVRLWDIFESKGHREIITTSSDALVVVFRPDGEELAVATLDANITFYRVPNAVQIGSIEGRNDLGSGRKDTDLVTAKKVLEGKCFTALCYSADGTSILAGGQSKHICIYNVQEQLLLRKFQITKNYSLDGMHEYVDRRKMTKYGHRDLIEEREDGEDISIRLPGVRRGDMASRAFKPEVRVSYVAFSPTGRMWAATTTEGLLVYSLDVKFVFDPMDLEVSVTPSSVHKTLEQKDYMSAVMQAFKLNEQNLIQEVLENVPVDNISFVSQNLPPKYVELLLKFLGVQLESTRHLEFYMLWIQSLLMSNGQRLQSNSMDVKSLLQLLHKNLQQKYKDLRTVCEHNKYSMAYILALGKQSKRKIPLEEEVEENSDDENVII